MKKIFIDSQLLQLGFPQSRGLISSLLKMNERAFSIYTERMDSLTETILQSENIEISSAANNDKCDFSLKFLDGKIQLINSNFAETVFNNLMDAIESLLRNERFAEISRKTKETDISVKIFLDGKGENEISTGIGFFDHMLEQIARHANVDLFINTKGDLHIDEHHTVEDTGIALGEAISKALGDKKGITRYGFFLPMDETIAQCGLDFSGRIFLNFKCKFEREKVGDFPTELTEEFFRALASGMKVNLYLRSKGKNDHHKIESMFKAFAKSLNDAVRFDERTQNRLPSTKGML